MWSPLNLRLDAMFLARKAELEAKFQKLYQPLSAKRFEIVNGVAEVDTPNDSSNNKGVPGFWLTALKSSKPIAGMISKADEGTLNYLKDIKWCRIVKPKGFKLEFFFNRNPYFKDLILTKAYHVEERRYEYVLKDILGTEIQWSITRTKTRKSFFNFFTPPKPLADGDYDEDRVRASASHFDWDYEIGCIIRNKIIPHAVKRFMGEVNDHGEDGCL